MGVNGGGGSENSDKMDEAGAGLLRGWVWQWGWVRLRRRRLGFDGAGFEADGQGAADWVEEALQGRRCGQEFGHAGLGEEGFEMDPGDGGFVLEGAEQPARAGGQGQGGDGARGADPVAAQVGAGGAVRAGGDAGHGGGDDAGGAVEAVAEAGREGGEARVAAEAQGDEADELGDDRAEAGREIRGQEAEVGPCG